MLFFCEILRKEKIMTFLSIHNDPTGKLSLLFDRLSLSPAGSGRFVLAVGSTSTSDVPGVSAAGACAASRRLTPKIDAEVLASGKLTDGACLPVSPSGIVSPVIISRAMVQLCRQAVSIVDCGSFYSPAVPHVKAGSLPAACVSSGRALSLERCRSLFRAGLEIGEKMAKDGHYLVIGECVPGGTTTAAAVLTALGFSVDRLVSSSMVVTDYELRRQLISRGLEAANLSAEQIEREPLWAVASVGDPMQPFVSGMAISASRTVPVILGGGSQMLAIWALITRLCEAYSLPVRREALAVVTTKWISPDSHSASSTLSAMLRAPLAASCPDFFQSRHPGLRAYELGNVKEGVGAGAAMAVAHAACGYDGHTIAEAIDSEYDELVAAPQGITDGKEAACLKLQ